MLLMSGAMFYLFRVTFAQDAEDIEFPPTPAEILQSLQEGNQRFAKGASKHPRVTLEQIKKTAVEQKPLVTVLTCSDSRVSPELLFDQGIGDLFVVRVAGNVADADEIGSVEYGVGHLKTPLLVVLGHTKCGAVTAVAQGAKSYGSIPDLIANIRPALARARKHECRACNHDLITRAIYENVWVSMEDLLNRSEEVRYLIVSGKLKMVGGVYDVNTGTVAWLGEHRDQARIIAKARSEKEAGASHSSGARAARTKRR